MQINNLFDLHTNINEKIKQAMDLTMDELLEKLKDYISKLCFHKLKPHFHSKVYKSNADFIRNDDNLSGLSDFLIAFSDEALPKDITLAVKGEFIPSRQAVYIPFCIAGLFADAIKIRPADENEINDQFYEFIEYKFSDVVALVHFASQTFDKTFASCQATEANTITNTKR